MKTDELKKFQREKLKRLMSESGAESSFSKEDSQGAEKILGALIANPSVNTGEEPPLGYETYLLAKLKAQLPEVKPVVHPEKVKAGKTAGSSIFAFLKSPQMSWGLSASMAIFIVVFAMSTRHSQNELSSPDLLVETASRGGDELAEQWLASVGDVGSQVKSQRGLSSLANELEESDDPQAVKKALELVAQTMGAGQL